MLLQGALNYLMEYQACSLLSDGSTPPTKVSWSPPSHNWYKINVDGAVFRDQKAAGVGVIVWDAEGTLIRACSKRIMAPLGAIEVEAKALEFGLQFAKDLSIHEFTLESDS